MSYYPDLTEARDVLSQANATERGPRAAVEYHAGDGRDELVLCPCTAEPERIDRIAEVVF